MRSKKLLLIGGLMAVAFAGTAQVQPMAFTDYSYKGAINLNNGGTNAATHPSLAFQIGGTNKATRPWPVLTTAQRNAIASPLQFATIANSTTGTVQVYNGTTWIDLGAGPTSTLQAVTTAGNTTKNDIVRTSSSGATLVSISEFSPTEGQVQVVNTSTGALSAINAGTIQTNFFQVNAPTGGWANTLAYLGTGNYNQYLQAKNGTVALLDDIDAANPVIEVANYAALPATGETGKLYVTLDTNLVYRWSGSVYVEIAASSIPTLQQVTDGAGNNETTNSIKSPFFEVPGRAALSDDGEGLLNLLNPTDNLVANIYAQTWSISYNSLLLSKTFSFGTAPTADVLYKLPSDEAGTRNIATREWVTAQGYGTGSAVIDTTTIATRNYAKKVGDSTYARAAAAFQPIGSYLTGIDTTTISTRNYAKKIGDSTFARVTAQSYLTTSTAASTYASIGRSIIAGTGLSGGGTFSADRTLAVDTFTISTRAMRQKLADSLAAVSAATYQTLAARVTKAVLIAWANSATVAANGTAYYAPGISGQTIGSTEAARQTSSPITCVARSLYVKTLLTQSALDQMTVALRVNGVTTPLTITIPAGATAGTFSDTTHSVNINAGDLLSYVLVNSAGATSAGIASISIELTNN